MRNRTLLFVALLLKVAARSALAAEPAHDFDKWEKEIAAFEEADRKSPPPKGEILFTGSSTIRRWTTLADDFRGHNVINRGFGGSEILDCTHFADRIVFPYEPRAIFLRSGGNDLHNGKTAEQAFGDFAEFATTVHDRLPKTEIFFISQNPSIARWNQHEQEAALNKMIKDFMKERPYLKYIEIADLPLDASGQPRPELFVEDKLHLNAAGYKLLAERVRPYLPKP